MENVVYDVVILGAGTAGLSAAVYAVRAGLKVLVIEQTIQGGQIIYAPDIENYPGILNISGTDFVNTLYKQATNKGVRVVYESVKEAELKAQPKKIITAKNTYTAKTVIIANGAKHRLLGVPGEDKFNGRGVSYCATCDGSFFKEKEICVVGGGNTALDDALYLSNICKKVYIIHRRDAFRGDLVSVNLLKQKENVVFILDSVVEEIQGDKAVTGVKVKNVKTDVLQEISVFAVFVAVGLQPENKLFENDLAIDAGGYIKAGEDCKTNLEGVFVAGDTRTKELRQLITAAADGAIAATGCASYINNLGV